MLCFVPARILGVCLCLVTLSAITEESAPSIGSAASTFFVVDYLPPAIYEGDAVSACFRIENTLTSKQTFDVVGTAVDSTGSEIKKRIEKATVAAGAFSAVKFDFESKRVARIVFELKNADEAKVLATTSVVLLRDHESWPETQFENGRMCSVGGQGVLIPVAEKKRAVEVREFAPMTWLFGESKDNPATPKGNSIAFVPGTWELKIDAAESLGPWRQDGSIPILKAADHIARTVQAAPPGTVQRAVVLLPPEDLELATDPRTYRVVLDALLARLSKAQIGRVVLIAPFKYGSNDVHRKAIWREIHESATVNTATARDPLDWMKQDAWRADAAVPNVMSHRPNAAGQKMIEQALSDLIR